MKQKEIDYLFALSYKYCLYIYIYVHIVLIYIYVIAFCRTTKTPAESDLRLWHISGILRHGSRPVAQLPGQLPKFSKKIFYTYIKVRTWHFVYSKVKTIVFAKPETKPAGCLIKQTIKKIWPWFLIITGRL